MKKPFIISPEIQEILKNDPSTGEIYARILDSAIKLIREGYNPAVVAMALSGASTILAQELLNVNDSASLGIKNSETGRGGNGAGRGGN